MKNYQKTIETCEIYIRSGQGNLAAKILSKISFSHVPREFRLPLAKLCRRVDQAAQGIKLLERTVHPKRPRDDTQATPEELAEYGVLLLRWGALREADKIFSVIDVDKAPDALLYSTFAHFVRFEYEQSIPKLERYLVSNLSPYWLLVGKLNLAYACIETLRFSMAEGFLHEIIETSRSTGNRRIESHALELQARLHVRSGNFGQARDVLSIARSVVSDGQTAENYLFRKWSAILAAFETRSLDALVSFREEMKKKGDWPNLRDVDRFSLFIDHDEKRFNFLYFGTPFAAFREQIKRDTGMAPKEMSYVYGAENSPCFNVMTGQIDGVERLRAGGKCHHLVEFLLRDFYRPVQLAEIFSELCPDEHFNVFTSPNRVHQILHRARQWIDEEKLPVEIMEKEGRYSLRFTDAFSFRIPLEHRPVNGYHQILEKVYGVYRDGDLIRSKEARERLGLTRPTFIRFAAWAVENGKLERIGSHNTAAYLIKRTA